mmetsp:Transcript_19873/g.52057  ORF Transcript_19873/g.52057 Transcript_19873/m.52057 type:complete len:87 (-) Transcript_19873:202-462(-)
MVYEDQGVVGDSALQHIDPEIAVDNGALMHSAASCQEEADASQSIAEVSRSTERGVCVHEMLNTENACDERRLDLSRCSDLLESDG